MDDFLTDMLMSHFIPTGKTRQLEEVRSQDGATWIHASAETSMVSGISSPRMARRTITQREVAQLFPDGRCVLGWETVDEYA